MSDASKAFITVFIFTIVGLIVGLVISPPIVQRMVEGAFTRWTSLGVPPEPITHLLGYGFGNGGKILVQVEAGSGKTYRCCQQTASDWQPALPSEIFHDEPCQELPSQAAAPPRPIVACVEVAAFEWVTDRTQFALLDDGTVWTWHLRVGFALGLILAVQSAILSGLLGFVVVTSAFILRRRKPMH